MTLDEDTHVMATDIVVTEWLRQNCSPYDALTPGRAGERGYMDTLEWSTNNNGCSFYGRVWMWCADARMKGRRGTQPCVAVVQR